MRILGAVSAALYWIFALLVVAAVAGIVAWCDSHGPRAKARVVAKRAIVYNWETQEPHGYSYQYYADVEFPLDEQAVGFGRWALTNTGQAALRLSEAQFDELHAGQPVAIRYLPCLPGFARLENQTLWHALAVRVSWYRLLGLALWLPTMLCCLYVWQSFQSRGAGRRTLLLALLTLLIGGAGQIMTVVTLGHESATTATVRALERITEQPYSSDTLRGPLLQPFVRVELEFPVAVIAEPVRAIDEIADGSVPNLHEGAAVRVTYAASTPREARIAGGSRWFLLINQLPQLGIGALLLLVAALRRWWRATPLHAAQPQRP